MDNISAEQFLRDQLPADLWPTIPTTLRQAYAAAEMLCSQEPILQVASAKANRGRIISYAVDLAFERLIKSGQWNGADYRWKSFAKPTGTYLEIRLSHSLITISQTDDPDKQPRNVVFRENARFSNQPQLFEADRASEAISGLPNFLLLHGHQQLTFATVAFPHRIHSEGHIYRTPNLMHIAHAVPSDDVAPMEITDQEAILSLKFEIEKWRKDNDQ